MRLLKHILIVFALMMASLPCIHAQIHEEHAETSETSLTRAACCACHSGPETPCHASVKTPQQRVSAAVIALVPSTCFTGFVPPAEPQPVLRQVPPQGSGMLASLQTVRLLI
jgi:hypothetical protein